MDFILGQEPEPSDIDVGLHFQPLVVGVPPQKGTQPKPAGFTFNDAVAFPTTPATNQVQMQQTRFQSQLQSQALAPSCAMPQAACLARSLSGVY